MIALFFDVRPKPQQEASYFDTAARLKPALDASGGLEFLDRSRSATRPEWFLSHQFWRDEASMARWRANPAHHHAQSCGRTEILDDYRLRVALVIAHVKPGHAIIHEPFAGVAAYNDPTATPDRFVVSTLTRTGSGHPIPGETFVSVYDPDLSVIVTEVASAAEGYDVLAHAAAHDTLRVSRLCLISRDYTMRDRREAPQYFPAVPAA